MISQINNIETLGMSGKIQKMPVKKYVENTFGDILNDAMYELQRKQYKFPEEENFFSTEGTISFIAKHILENLPEWEKEEEANGASDHSHTDSKASLPE